MNINSIIEKNIKLIFKILFLFLTLFINRSFSQSFDNGSPYFKNFTPIVSNFRDNNFKITQDDRGFIYVGNVNGIVEFDGFSWNSIPFSGNPILYKSRKGGLFAGGYNEIFSLIPDKQGKIITNKIFEDTTSQIGQITNLIYENNLILLTNSVDVFIIKDNILSKILTDKSASQIFYLHNHFLIANSEGIYSLKNNNIYSQSNCELIKGHKIYDLYETNLGFMIITNYGFYEYINNVLVKRQSSIDHLLPTMSVTSAIEIPGKIVAVGTKNDGICFLDYNLDLISNLNKDNGLYDNHINHLFVDKDNSLWAAFSNGLCLIEIPSAFSYFNQHNGLKGKVNDIIRFKKELYVATSQGLYILNKKNLKNEIMEPDFVKISGFDNEVNVFRVVGERLLVGSNDGISEIQGTTVQKIYEGNVLCILRDYTDATKFYFSDNEFLLSGFHSEKGWIFTNPLTKLPNNITSIAQDRNKLWLGTKYSGVFSISTINHNNLRVNYGIEHGLPDQNIWIDVYQTSGDILFSTNDGIYRFNQHISKFEKDSVLHLSNNNTTRVKPIVEDNEKNIWISYDSENSFEKKIAVAWNIENSNKRYSFISQPFKRVNDFMCEAIYPDENFVVWFGGFEGLVRLDFKKLKQEKSDTRTFIRKVIYNYDSVVCYGTEFKDINYSFSIPYNDNSLKFEYSTPIYLKDDKVFHQTYLEGFDKTWTKPDLKYSQTYTNLRPGSYCFRVRAVDYYGNVSEMSSVNFTIITPFYQRWWAIAIYILTLVSLVLVILRWRAYKFLKEKASLERIISERTEQLLQEKEKTETLLANILPENTVKELKDKGRASSMKFEMVTVLFSDIQGFTKIAEKMNPDVLVDQLDKFFHQFDLVVDKYNIEKIKTIGDAYMCAGGIPKKNRTNPIEVVIAALEMQHMISVMKQEAGMRGEEYWGLRIGIHTGPVIAGVIGSKKFTYDIWGDSVNIASRMESTGEVGRVNISEDTYTLIKDYFDCEYRGKMPVKYKGEIAMYFVNGFKANFCSDKLCFVPNSTFLTELALIRYEDLHEFMLDKLEKELPKNLYYHGLKHTIDVVVHIEIIGKDEGVSKEELLLLKTAALFHDSGFMIGYHDHEQLGVELANEILPNFHFSKEQIKVISDLIYATKMPYNPSNKLEEIICDADLDYLGRTDYLPVSRNLYRELLEQNIINKSESEWNKMQLKFLQNHRFYTESSKRRRNQSKNDQIKKLKDQNFKFETDLIKKI